MTRACAISPSLEITSYPNKDAKKSNTTVFGKVGNIKKSTYSQ